MDSHFHKEIGSPASFLRYITQGSGSPVEIPAHAGALPLSSRSASPHTLDLDPHRVGEIIL